MRGRAYEPPQGEIETALARDLGGGAGSSSRVGRHDNFFELGGHSLMAVRVIERMRRSGLCGGCADAVPGPDLGSVGAAGGSDALGDESRRT